MTLAEAEALCKSLGGQLPSLHSNEDAQFLSNIVPAEQNIWLAGRHVSRSPRIFEWTDGTAFDYVPWKSPHPNCEEECCGIALHADTDDGRSIFDCSCSNTRLAVCKITMSVGSLSERITSLSQKVRMLDQEMQSFLSLTDFASRNISDQTEKMRRDEEKTRERIKEMVALLNSSIQINGHERRDMVVAPALLKPASIADPGPADAYEQVAQLRDQVKTNTVCLIIMSVFVVFLITIFLYKFLNR